MRRAAKLLRDPDRAGLMEIPRLAKQLEAYANEQEELQAEWEAEQAQEDVRDMTIQEMEHQGVCHKCRKTHEFCECLKPCGCPTNNCPHSMQSHYIVEDVLYCDDCDKE
jgi:hypothetical protein